MPGMQRFVSYLYLYENEEKAGNVGFAKIELRGEDCRIEVHLRGTFTNNLSCKIYLFTNQQDFIHGTYIGNMKILNGVGNFGKIVPAEQMNSSGKKFADMEGLLILCEDKRIFATRWKEGAEVPISIKRFRTEPEASEASPTPEPSAPAASVEPEAPVASPTPATPTPAPSAPAASSATERLSPKPRVPKPSASAQARSGEAGTLAAEPSVPAQRGKGTPSRESSAPARSDKATSRQEADAPQGKAASRPSVPQGEAAPCQEPSVHIAEVPMRNIFPEIEWREQWENMLREYPVSHPFSNEEITCIRIELKDLRELPKRYWYLGNNSFLLHGFFNYHYLIVGKKQEDGVERWFLGVPGVYQHQERVMAAIFGFQDFLPEARNHEKTGEPINQFGYWCRQMDD